MSMADSLAHRSFFSCKDKALNVRINKNKIIIQSHYNKSTYCVVCVVIPFILDVRLVDVPAGVTQDFSTFLLRCLPPFLSREGFSRPFPWSTVESNFCVPTN